MSESKDQQILVLAKHAVRELLALDESVYGSVVSEQTKRVAIELGNMLAPQLYGSRIHGVGNAVSVAIRYCSEALFWLNLSDANCDSAINAVTELHDFLASP